MVSHGIEGEGGKWIVKGLFSKRGTHGGNENRVAKTRSLTNAQKLINLLDFAKGCDDRSMLGRPSPIIPMIKALTDKIMLTEAFRLMTRCDYYGHPLEKVFNTYLFRPPAFPCEDKCHLQERVRKALGESEIDSPEMTVDLSLAPVLPWLRKRDSLRKTLASVGTECNPWQEDELNHLCELWLPIGVMFVNNGNHSIAAGQIRCSGSIHFGRDKRHRVFDISPLYQLIRFDGSHYRWIGKDRAYADSVVGTASSFEFGCIFELGRLLAANNRQSELL